MARRRHVVRSRHLARTGYPAPFRGEPTAGAISAPTHRNSHGESTETEWPGTCVARLGAIDDIGLVPNTDSAGRPASPPVETPSGPAGVQRRDRWHTGGPSPTSSKTEPPDRRHTGAVRRQSPSPSAIDPDAGWRRRIKSRRDAGRARSARRPIRIRPRTPERRAGTHRSGRTATSTSARPIGCWRS